MADRRGMVPSLRRLGPWALLALAGTALLAWLGLQGFAFSDYDARRRRPSSRWRTATRRLPLARPGLRRLADHARAVRDAARPVGRRRARGVPGRRHPVPGRGRRPRASCWPGRCSPAAHAKGTRASSSALRRQPDHAARARDRPSRGAARRRALRRRRAGRARGRPTLAGVLLGLAVANKAWALLAVGPVLLALHADRGRALAIAGAIAAASWRRCCWPPGDGAPGRRAATGEIFQPWQVWWFLGRPAR